MFAGKILCELSNGIDIVSNNVFAASSGDLGVISSSDAGQASPGGSFLSNIIPLSTGAIICLCVAVFLIIMAVLEVIRSKYVLSVSGNTVLLENLPDSFHGTRLAVISDLHQMRFGEYNELLAKHIRREEPDYILIAGDMGDAVKFKVDAFYDFLESLGRDIPVIMVPGNHDLILGGGSVHKNFVLEMEHAGATLLDNSCAQMLSGGGKLYIYGFCPPLEPKKDESEGIRNFAPVSCENLESKLGKCPGDAPVILLAHDPAYFEAYSRWGADLIICGHNHGGVVRLPFVGGLMADSKYTSGMYENENSRMFVSRGLGSTKGRRFLNAPEIGIIKLVNTLEPDPALEGDMDEVDESVAKLGVLSVKEQLAGVKTWFRSEVRSLKDLLNERMNQLSDFFAMIMGKERSRFSKAADEKKISHTYVAPKKGKNINPNRSRTGANQGAVYREHDKDSSNNKYDRQRTKGDDL